MSSEFQHTLIGHGMEDTFAGELSRSRHGLLDEKRKKKGYGLIVPCDRRRLRINSLDPPRQHARRIPAFARAFVSDRKPA